MSLTGTAPLRSERLSLRPWRGDDAPVMQALCQDDAIRHWAGLPDFSDLDDVRTYIDVGLGAQMASGTGIAFAIEIRSTGAIAGSIGLYRIRRRTAICAASAMAGMWVGSEHRRQGIATEALRTAAFWAFVGLRLDRIVSFYLAGNAATRRVNERVGFTGGALMRSAGIHAGRPADMRFDDLVPADLGLDFEEHGTTTVDRLAAP